MHWGVFQGPAPKSEASLLLLLQPNCWEPQDNPRDSELVFSDNRRFVFSPLGAFCSVCRGFTSPGKHSKWTGPVSNLVTVRKSECWSLLGKTICTGEVEALNGFIVHLPTASYASPLILRGKRSIWAFQH